MVAPEAILDSRPPEDALRDGVVGSWMFRRSVREGRCVFDRVVRVFERVVCVFNRVVRVKKRIVCMMKRVLYVRKCRVHVTLPSLHSSLNASLSCYSMYIETHSMKC